MQSVLGWNNNEGLQTNAGSVGFNRIDGAVTGAGMEVQQR